MSTPSQPEPGGLGVERPTVLVLSVGYPPGFKQGGPIRSVEGLVSRLGDFFRFKVVTLDRYPGDATPYPDTPSDVWVERAGAEVLYLSPGNATTRNLISVLRRTPHDLLYLNSFFSPKFGLFPLLFRGRGRFAPPVILAPRGQFAASALRIRQWKKRPCLALARMSGVSRGILWQATSQAEAQDIRRVWGRAAEVIVAPNLRRPETGPGAVRLPKQRGSLHVVFLSRLARMKNLLGAVQILAAAGGPTTFSISGVADDPDYWSECQAALANLHKSIRWNYAGVTHPDQVGEFLANGDLHLLPTLGENFGHVIIESWLAGCPVLISDRTCWSGLESLQAGWDLPLDDLDGFVRVLKRVRDMDDEEHAAWRRACLAQAHRVTDQTEGVRQNVAMFRQALRPPGPAPRPSSVILC